MVRLTLATLAMLYLVLYVFGDPARRAETAAPRAEASGFGFEFLNASFLSDGADGADLPATAISEDEAIARALEAGARHRADPDVTPERAVQLATTEAAAEAPAAPDYRYVTGSVVNLREGPGTGNPVVATASYGAEAEVLGETDGWYRIRLADGSAAGWIFGRFLGAQRPG